MPPSLAAHHVPVPRVSTHITNKNQKQAEEAPRQRANPHVIHQRAPAATASLEVCMHAQNKHRALKHEQVSRIGWREGLKKPKEQSHH